jgi:PEP-utilizing family enzyme
MERRGKGESRAQGVTTIATAFYPKDVIVRLSDFKSNEHANLLGARASEPKEENPMLGFHGASRYDDPPYQAGVASFWFIRALIASRSILMKSSRRQWKTCHSGDTQGDLGRRIRLKGWRNDETGRFRSAR